MQATKSTYLTVRTVQVEGAILLCDTELGINRPLVPLADRPAVFHAIHSRANHGICANKCKVTACILWKFWARTLQPCAGTASNDSRDGPQAA